jgi:hypothetical protein
MSVLAPDPLGYCDVLTAPERVELFETTGQTPLLSMGPRSDQGNTPSLAAARHELCQAEATASLQSRE